MPFRFFLITLIAISLLSCDKDVRSVAKWDTISFDFKGPMTSEMDEMNPFLDYRLMVDFTNSDKNYSVPGYYAADGNAGETSADSGNIWKVNFRPDQVGDWSYKVSFRKGEEIAISDQREVGEPVSFDGTSGKFKVIDGQFAEPDFRSKGRLEVIKGVGYQRFAETGEYFIKGGAGSPETFLAYKDFDGTYDIDEDVFLHQYQPHLRDWNEGDPTWQDGKGKGIIGGLNYLSHKGMNTIYFLTMNIEGDGNDTWPYVSHSDVTRFDCSKLDQWNMVFEHAQRKGIFLHMLLQETENETLLDGGETGRTRSLYFREMIARFGHHLALEWDMGEENGPVVWEPVGQSTAQQKAMFQYFKTHDPYHNLVAIHTHSSSHERDAISMPLLGDSNLDAFSMQIDQPAHVASEFAEWKQKSIDAGHELILYMDEIGPYWQGVSTDANDIAHDTIRREVLWGSLMAGGAGVEWYFGYTQDPGDLNCEDWRSRDAMWDQTKYALDFFKTIPFDQMRPNDDLLNEGGGQCLEKPGDKYAVYLPFGRKDAQLKVIGSGEMKISWYNPRKGRVLDSAVGYLKAVNVTAENGVVQLGAPPVDDGMDWVALVEHIK